MSVFQYCYKVLLTRDRFHQTLFAKQKVAGTQSLAKKFTAQFYKQNKANSVSCLTNLCAVYQRLLPKKLIILLAQKSQAQEY
jgi:hypothetical protein